MKIAMSTEFLTAFAKLPRKVQSKTTEFFNKFRMNPNAPGIKYEKLKNTIDDKLWSVRIDDTYRGIVARQEKTGTYLLLWVDHHDEAYAWARRKRCQVSPLSGLVQLFEVQEAQDTQAAPAPAPVSRLFAAFSDEELIKLGLPGEQLPLVRSFEAKEDFQGKMDMLPKDAYENLHWLTEGIPFDEVLEMAEAERAGGSVGDDLGKALEKSSSLSSFVVVEGEEDLRRILAEPLEKWRVFLHPTQRKLVEREYSGAARVLGTAGTGKTVVAMHRARQLAAKCSDEEKILFTTFTANLADDIKANLRKICSVEELRRIEVKNLDAWVAGYLREQDYSAEIVYGEKLCDLWEEAVTSSGTALAFHVDFYEEEWSRVIVANEAFSLPLYAKAPRTGRGTRLDRRKRMEVWKVVEAYQQLMKERGVRDVNMAMYECATLLKKLPQEPYRHVIVDEGQDLSSSAFRLLRALAGKEHANDLFIVGDAHQRIYKNKATLSKCGINIRGRSSVLKINYRTTEETRKAAFAILGGLPFDDLDGALVPESGCQSLTHGEKPTIKGFKDAAEELDYLLAQVRRLKEGGVPLSDICVVARTHKLIEGYLDGFVKNGVRAFELKKNKTDDRSIDGVRLATMHRVKGLEFKYVFIVAANSRVLPLASAIDYTDNVTKEESLTAERCLLYVAMTRAQKAVTITGYGHLSEFLDK